MCGISAVIHSRSQPVTSEQIRKMNHEIRHRGPDAEGIFIDGSVGLGHRMLKIVDLGPGNTQPMRFKDYTISYNGEIYNFRELRLQLKKLGYSFETETDTEVILAAYDHWKEECVHYFNGMWAFVLYDANKKLIFVSRDRFGMKPVCYCELNDKFLIGSEIKQFTAFNDFNPKLDDQAAFHFLYEARLNNSHKSMFEGVHYLLPGHNLIYQLNSHKYKINAWYEFSRARKKSNISLPDAISEFRHLFTTAVLSHTYSRATLGSCLSGGADSTSIVGVATKAGVNLSTFSSCLLESEYNEISFIDAAVNLYGQDNHKIYPDVHELITKCEMESLVYHQDQPVVSGSFFAESKLFGLAAAHNIRVLLSGGGADEYLGGYGEFSHVYRKSLVRERKFLRYMQEISPLLQLKLQLGNIARRLFPTTKQPLAIDILEVITKSFNPKWFDENFIAPEAPHDKKNIDELSRFALLNYSLPLQVHSEDRNAMRFSIESRLPFLDHRLVEFCLSLPDEMKLRNGISKYVLKQSMQSILPEAVYNRRQKLGFPGPEEPLFQSHAPEVSKRFKEIVSNFHGIFSDDLVTMLLSYSQGKIPYNNFLFRVLTFGAWAKRFNISCASSQHSRKTNQRFQVNKQASHLILKS